jgi:hypothetical protein
MMTKISKFAAALAITLVGLPVFAATEQAPQTAAGRDMSKLSTDGATAIHDVWLARLAIFNGDPVKANQYAHEARAALDRAKLDHTAFAKAESDLKVPKGATQPGSGATPSTTPTTWIPVDGSVTLGEDYVDTPEKAASVAKANEQLKNGDHKQALETIKLANIDVSFVLELAPLDKTAAGIEQAVLFLDAGKYYEANHALKEVEDGLRIDVTDVDSTPEKTAK